MISRQVVAARAVFSLLISALAVPHCWAGTAVEWREFNRFDPIALDASAAASPAAHSSTQRHQALLGLDRHAGLTLIDQLIDADGARHFRYQQTVQGLPVWGAELVVSESAQGETLSLSGAIASHVTVKSNAALTSLEQAIDLATLALQPSGTDWARIEGEAVRDIVFIDDDRVAHRALLVSFFAEPSDELQLPSRPFAIIDAATGAVLRQWNGMPG